MLRSGRMAPHKERFFAIPNDGKITFNDSKAWEFEDGAVTVKSFSLDMEAGKPAIPQANRNAHRRQAERPVGRLYLYLER